MRLPSLVVRGRNIFVLMAMLFPLGCEEGLGDPTGSTCPENSTLTYETFGRDFFSSHCLSCHAATQTPHFNTQAEIQQESDEIDRAAASGPDATNTFMPEEGEVSDADRKKLGEWLACGAP